jgi:hypothetical protein
VQKAAAAVAQQLNIKKEAVLPACLIADVERALHGRRLQQNDDDDDAWDQGIASEGSGCLISTQPTWVRGCSWPFWFFLDGPERQWHQGQHTRVPA